MTRRYVVRPKADLDLEDQAYYYATKAGSELGHRFLEAAHNTFALLASQPQMGWHARIRHADLEALRLFRITGFERILIFYRPRHDGVDILRVVHSSRSLRKLLRHEGLE